MALTNPPFFLFNLIRLDRKSEMLISRLILKIIHLLPIFLFICALYIVHNQLKIHDLRDILASLQSMPMWIIFAAFVLTLINYLVLAGYDWLALHFTKHTTIPLCKVIPAALISYSISNNTGHAWAAGGSIRYRFYSKWGVPGWDILKISLFQAVTYLLGALSLGFVGSLLLPQYLPRNFQEPQPIHWVSIICAVSLLVYWSVVLVWRKPLLIKGVELHLPSPTMTFFQTVVSGIDVVFSSLVLWVLLLGKVDISFGAFLIVFVVAQVVGVISQVPGGIGIFETTFLWLVSGVEAEDQHLILISALVLYRAIYYFVPLLLAGAGLLGYELYSRRKLFIETGFAVSRILSVIAPQFYSVLLLLAGSLLIISGAIPENPEMMGWLRYLVPLSVVELSHLMGSLIGLLLLLLARGIFLKIDAAWYGSLFLLGLGIVTSLLKGFAWHEASALLIIMILLLPSRRQFQRQSSLLQISFSKSWMSTILMVLVGSLWLGFFAYRDVEYTHELWWQFSYDGNAPRFLRAFLLISVVMVFYGLSRLLNLAPPLVLNKPTETELAEVQKILNQCVNTHGFLVLLGDKYVLWNTNRDAFIMFAMTPGFWIAMGDPIGCESSIEPMLWQFQEQADRYGAKVVFYQISQEYLPNYLDLGLSLYKLGEEARVDLKTFNLHGKSRETQRSTRNKFHKMHYVFEVLSGDSAAAVLPELRSISNDWLSHKNTQEKRFSLGFFDENYLQYTDIAVIKNELGSIKAFANLWKTTNKQELSIDLMRYSADSPKGIMDFLFVELMFWGQNENYQWFSLGMAPLAGLERRPLAPLWHKIGAVIFDMGDQFYNFEGLYGYKAKFAPQWQTRYLAAPNGFFVPLILLKITRIISGSWQGIFNK
jgi:phosphatidylglycerol lysyltransferase